jgi:serine protease Do
MAADEEPGKVFDTLQQSVQAVFSKCRSAVVRIEAVDRHGQLSGTGFFIDPNGTLYTSYTVGGESRNIHVTMGGERYMARRLVSDLRSGVAILKIEAETPFLPFGNSRQLTVASPVIAIGFPMDFPLTPAFGTVAGFDLKYQGRYFATTHIRANIPVQCGEGGAPLLNARGEVVGILISSLDSGSASFVVPIEAAEKVRKDFVRFHEVRPGWVGIHVKTLPESVSGSTAYIEEIIPESPAEKAGLRNGDVLLQVGGLPITSLEDMINASFFLSADDETVLRVTREGSEREFSVVPVDHPDLSGPRVPDPSGPRLPDLGGPRLPALGATER